MKCLKSALNSGFLTIFSVVSVARESPIHALHLFAVRMSAPGRAPIGPSCHLQSIVSSRQPRFFPLHSAGLGDTFSGPNARETLSVFFFHCGEAAFIEYFLCARWVSVVLIHPPPPLMQRANVNRCYAFKIFSVTLQFKNELLQFVFSTPGRV